MPDVFLSYSREDQPTARRFAEALKREGFNVWWDQALDAGESFDKVTEQALKDAKAVVVLWSKHAVDSRWVRAEATQADRFGTLVPVTIEPCNRPIMFELTHTADLSGWNGDVAAAPWRAFIEGLRRSVGKTTTLPVLAASAATPTAPISSAAAASHPIPRAAIAWTVVAAALLLAAGLYWYFHGRQAAAPVAKVDATVAVLPFRDMSPNKDQEYFADGITEEILNALSRVQGLTVTARTSSFAFKGKDVSLREVGKMLGVAHILEGSIRKDGDQLRITAQLIDTRADAHLWSRTYNRPMQDVFKVQEEIAREVAVTLAISLGVGEGSQVPGFTRNVEAYDAFLQANNAMQSISVDSTLRAIDLFIRAVALDPGFAGALVRLSDAYVVASSMLPDPPGKPWRQLTDEAMDEARRISPDAFYVLFGDVERSMREGRWNEVARLYDQIEADASRQGLPFNADGARSLFTLIVGRAREAVQLQERYRSRNPLDSGVAFVMGEAYADIGSLQAAFDEFDRAAKLENPSPQLWGGALLTAMGSGDRKLVESRLDAIIGQRTGGIALYTAMKPLLGKPSEGLAELRRIDAQSPGPQIRSTIAAWAAYFGDPVYALEILRAQATRGAPTDILRYWRPVMKDVRKLPGFKELVRERGLVDYWRKNGWGDFCKPVGEKDFECS